MSLRIAFDVDGVLADMESELVRHAEALFGRSTVRRPQWRVPDAAVASPDEPPQRESHRTPPDEPPPTRLAITVRQERRLWRHVGLIDGFWESLKETEPGIVRRLAGLVNERRWEVIFLTRRPESAGAPAQVQTQRWLTAHGFMLPSVFVVHGSRGRVAAALDLDAVVDDRLENCLEVVAESRARAVLVCRDSAQAVPEAVRRLGISIVKSMEQCLSFLSEVDSVAPDQPGLIGRVLSQLGLGESRADR